MEKLVYFCQGESHKATNKVCQDYAVCSLGANLNIAALSDGHGGNRYFRSNVGSKAIVDCTIQKVKEFVECVDSSIFKDKHFTAISALTTERKSDNLRKIGIIDKQLKQLFASIIYSWRTRIEKHLADNPFSEEELKMINNPEDPHSIDKTYGCTLMCSVVTVDYWFAFHIGDGKCFSFDKSGHWHEPIPWDERCFLNKTTSICDTNALDEFRYCYEGDGQFPTAIFLASDGLDDSFGESSNQANFYIQVLKLLANTSNEEVQKEIEDTLPQLSKIGSKDDMSIACLYDKVGIDDIVNLLTLWQRDSIQEEIDSVNEKINSLIDKQVKYDSLHQYSKKELIDAQYIQTELERQYAQKNELADKFNRFSKELDSANPKKYSDSLGLFQYEEEEKRKLLTSEQIKKRMRVLNHPIYKSDQCNQDIN